MALGADRPPVAGLLAFSGFIPTVDAWEPSFGDRQATRVFISHGNRDPVISVEFAHRARDLIAAAGLPLEYLVRDQRRLLASGAARAARDGRSSRRRPRSRRPERRA
jgi:hypothetical protein